MKEMVERIVELNVGRLDALKAVDKPKIGWTSIYTPEEILYAAGFIPFRIMGTTASNTSEAGALLGNNYCSYLLNCLGEGMDGVYEFTDGIVFVDECDWRKRLYETWNHRIQPKYSFFLELPKALNSVSRDYFRMQVRRMIESLEQYFGCRITEESLREAIRLFNETRRLLQRMHDLRKQDVTSLTGSELLNIMKSSTAGMRQQYNQELSLLLGAMEAQRETKKTKPHKVLICGSYFDHDNIVDAIEQTGAKVVCMDITNGVKYFEGEVDEHRDPVEAIADYYFDKATCARMFESDIRLNHLVKLIDEYDIDSVIYFSLKFCDIYSMDYPYIQSKLSEKGTPVLLVEGECSMTNIESIRTRIHTFLETMMY
ncbi:2-hydroxyacyl-CoA dehydratase subunit D [Paenibacillus tyrfis]|uniref:2-hydroxyacyl-CoA dehydratase subunit D n=1 Tax=Paenibacillus tyrfis TaxID=1501230 RepID=UPI00209F3DF8|nr:2-hydroxyacyl-CoA dehydratase family protein [Paenibacillus tyrfis]MCP1308855.1 2-hydroxyacyl-CoA dehydratase family protein [Paenibacillus tyrfis]